MAKTTLSPKTVEWVLEHLQKHNDTDIFHKPFELEAIYFGKDQFIKNISSIDISQWKTRPYRRCLVPKQRYGFRLATQLDPVDTIFYLCLMLEAGEKIEEARLSIDKKISFSYRFAPDDKDYTVFDKSIGYSEFQKYSGELAKKHGFVVVTDIDDLKPEEKERIDGLNLSSLLEEQISREDFDIPMTKFLINRVGQLKHKGVLSKLVRNIDTLHPVLAEIIRYVAEIGEGLDASTRERVGSFLLDKLQDSVLSNLEFNKMQIMSLFAGSNSWGNSDRLAKYYGMETGAFFRRTVILAIGKARHDWWLRTKKLDIDQMSPWDKRAFLYAASCFPKDEKEHWFRTISKSRTDILDTYIIDWANKHPIT